jgi:alkylhydroperoxidase/carboxymuconolactone decarboxylase family protein YurZ
MWINLAASVSAGDDQRTYSSARDAVAAGMTAGQIAEAQRLAREWKPKPPT